MKEFAQGPRARVNQKPNMMAKKDASDGETEMEHREKTIYIFTEGESNERKKKVKGKNIGNYQTN